MSRVRRSRYSYSSWMSGGGGGGGGRGSEDGEEVQALLAPIAGDQGDADQDFENVYEYLGDWKRTTDTTPTTTRTTTTTSLRGRSRSRSPFVIEAETERGRQPRRSREDQQHQQQQQRVIVSKPARVSRWPTPPPPSLRDRKRRDSKILSDQDEDAEARKSVDQDGSPEGIDADTSDAVVGEATSPGTEAPESGPQPAAASPPQQQPNNPKPPDDAAAMRLTPALLTAAPTRTLSIPLFIASIGNPGKEYANTLHSAGHVMSNHLISALGMPPPERAGKKYGGGLVSHLLDDMARADPDSRLKGMDDWTLWQSNESMNISGNKLGPAWREWLAEKGHEEGRLVILHDQLESKPGVIKLKKGGSQNGHKGLTSCNRFFHGSVPYRISLGIGRPESHDPKIVAAHVLRRFQGHELNAWRDAAPRVLDLLRAISDDTVVLPPPQKAERKRGKHKKLEMAYKFAARNRFPE